MSYIEKLKKLVLAFMEEEQVHIYLFGSWARGEQRHSSDVDLAIEYLQDYAPSKIAALREYLEESTVPYRVDVVDMRAASDELLTAIRKDGRAWR